MWLTGPKVPDSQAWPKYLTVDEVSLEWMSQAANWESCAEAPDAAVSVEVAFSKAGAVAELKVDSATDSCWSRHLRNLEIPNQQEPDLKFRFAMLTAQGRVVSFAQVEKVQRSQFPAFIHLPLGLPGPQRSSILQALGLAENAAAE